MQKQQSALMVMLNVVVQWSDHVILIVSRIVNQQFPAPFVPFFFFFFLRPVLGMWWLIS